MRTRIVCAVGGRSQKIGLADFGFSLGDVESGGRKGV